MKTLNQIIAVMALGGLSVAVGEAQDLAVFKVPDSTRPFVFNLRPRSFDPAPSANTNSTRQGVDGLMTVLARRFDTERRTGVVAIRFYDVIVCQANRCQGEGSGSPVFSTDAFAVEYPGDPRILLCGRSVLLADLSEKMFDPPTFMTNYTGLVVVKTNGLTRTRIASGPNPTSVYDSVRDGEKAQAKFSGGDGSSIKDAVVITARSERTGDRAAYIWLHEHYPGSRLQEEGLDYDDSGRYYSEIKIVTSDGKSRTVFFEVTSFWGNGKK